MNFATLQTGGFADEDLVQDGWTDISQRIRRRVEAAMLEPGETALAGAAGVVVVPAAGVEGVALEVLDAGDARQLGPARGAQRHDHEPGLHVVAAVGPDPPALEALVPGELVHPGLEAGQIVEAVAAADPL